MLRSTLIPIGLAAALIFSARTALDRIALLQPVQSRDQEQRREMQYLPSGKGLHALSFGYSNALAHFLWFNTISYFGKHHRSDQNYRWLAHMCNLVSDLNPRAGHVYEFCSTMLSWEAKLPEESVKLLSKVIRYDPKNWMLYYQRGFVYMFFLHDSDAAQADFLKASALPNAHSLVKRLAAKRLAASDNARAAVEFLAEMLRSERDPAARAALEGRLREARYELDLQTIEKARDIFVNKFGRLPDAIEELSKAGIIAPDLRDPFGGSYRIDPQSGGVSSTSNHKRLLMYQGSATS